MDAAERKRLVAVLRKGGVVLLGRRFITSESQLPSFINPPVLGELLFTDPEVSHAETHSSAVRADRP
jgi:hypothetical protein